MICAGIDWAEEHHDVAVMADDGTLLSELRIGDTVEGVTQLHALFAEHAANPADVVVGTESVHGLVGQALVGAGYTVYEINPLASNRYRDRHHLSGAKSDKADAIMLADMVRTDRHRFRPYAQSSSLAEALKVLARSHQALIWARQSQLNHLRSTLRQYYPAALIAFPCLCSPQTRDCPEAMAVLDRAPTPTDGRGLSKPTIRALLHRAGRQRSLDRRAGEVQDALRAPQLQLPDLITSAYGATVRATVNVVSAMTEQIGQLEQELGSSFEHHPDAEIYRSLPGLGMVLGARALAEFGDGPNRYVDPKSRKNYATTSPVTKASGKLRIVTVRHGGNRQLGQICLRWAYCSLKSSPGSRRYYDAVRARHKTHAQAMRTLANRLVGVLHGCLAKHEVYSEEIAWPIPVEAAA